MQDKFGKKLEEARMRRGVSIRQASDDLKIRADFLLSLEINHGVFDMPNVYKVGFLKLYARYLKLNPEEVAEDFNAYHQNDDKKGRQKEEREHLGRIELISTEAPVVLNPNSNFDTPEETEPISTANFKDANLLAWIKNPYIKTGVFFGGSLAILTVMAFVISNAFLSSGTETATQTLAQSQSELAEHVHQVAEQLVLLGEDNIHIVVRQEQDKQRLFTGNIDKDHPVTITRKGPVKIHFTDGSKLRIQKADGTIVKPDCSGAGTAKI